MEITLKSISLIIAVLLTGLSAGLFYAWSVSVIPGTRKVIDITYLEAMQSINRAILNPAFFLIFFGSAFFLVIATFQQYGAGLAFWLMLSATITYLLGTVGVTGLGNVPLNEALDALKLAELSTEEITVFRQHYELKWNQFHTTRTGFAVLSFLLSLAVLIAHPKL